MVLNNDIQISSSSNSNDLSSCESEKSTSDLITIPVISEIDDTRYDDVKLKCKQLIEHYESQLDAPYRNKKFYSKEWLFQKINVYKKQQHSNCSNGSILTLIGDSGNGKTHLACELKWPTQIVNVELSKNILCVYFLNIYLNKLNLINFYNYLKISIYNMLIHTSMSNMNIFDGLDLEKCDEPESNKLADKFITCILKQIKNINIDKKYYLLIDGIDEALLQEQFIKSKCTHVPFNVTDTLTSSSSNNNAANEENLLDSYKYSQNSRNFLLFLSKIYKHLPPWLNLIFTCKRVNERRFLKKYFNLNFNENNYFKICIDICVTLKFNDVKPCMNNENVQKIPNSEDAIKPPNDTSIMTKSMISTNPSSSTSASTTSSTSSTKSSSSSKNSSFSSNKSSISDINIPSETTTNNTSQQSVDIINSTHFSTLKDIQTYILKRLDNDYELKLKFNKLNAIDMLNLLLIKSNCCILYVEKIFDLILLNLINSREIRDIPVTLYGLYLFLIERILLDLNEKDVMLNASTHEDSDEQPNKKDLIFSIFNIYTATLKPFNKFKLFNLLKLRFLNLNFNYYENLFDLIIPILFRKYECNKNDEQQYYVLYHTSFIEWFTDIKFCTSKYLYNLNEGHFIMSLYYLKKLRLKQVEYEIQNSKKMVQNGGDNDDDDEDEQTLINNNKNFNFKKLILKFKLNLFNSFPLITHIEFNYLYSFINMFNECFNANYNFNKTVLFDAVKIGDLENVKLWVSKGVNLELIDDNNQTVLLLAVKLNKFEIIEYLAKIPNINLDHCDNEGWTALRYASWTGQTNIVQSLLENGACVDACDLDGRTALRAAVFGNHENIVKLLIDYGANVNKCDIENRSVLQIACVMGHLNLACYLVKNNSNLNYKDANGRNVLSSCIVAHNKCNSLELIKCLIESENININDCDLNNQNALILAVKEQLVDIVLLLLNSNIDIDCIDNDGYTAISYAIQNKNIKIIEILLEYDAATHILDKEGRSILSLACSNQCEDAVRMLTQKGLDEMHKDNYGWTPLHEATYVGNLNIVDLLIKYGSDVNDCDNEGKTCLYYACQEGHFDVVKLLIENNASIKQRSHDGNTPLRITCLQGHKNICEYLLLKNEDVDYKDPDGRTTLYCMVLLSKKTDMIEFLLKNNANVNIQDTDGRSCLHIAAHVGNIHIVKLILNYNPNIELVDNGGRTPLLIACWNDNLNVVKELLNVGADVNHQDLQGATPLSIASQKGNYQLVNELLNHGALIYASSRNPIKLALRGGFNNIAQLLQSNSLIQIVPRTSKSYDSFRFSTSHNTNTSSNNTERTILATLNRRQQQQRGLQSSYSMSYQIGKYTTNENSNHIDYEVRSTSSSIKPQYYAEPSYRKLNEKIKEETNSISSNLSSIQSTPQASPMTKPKSSSNNKILQILRKKFKFLTNSNDATHKYQNEPTVIPQIPRSRTDTISTKTTTTRNDGDDDSAYIFNRSSLNNYFNQRNSINQYNDVNNKANITKRPSCLPINNSFKKETSI